MYLAIPIPRKLMKYFRETAFIAAIFVFSFPAGAQTTAGSVTNEYRATFVGSRPVSDKVTLYQYLEFLNSPNKGVKTLYYSLPGVIYKPKPWMELRAGVFGLYHWNKDTTDSWEMRPRVGVKFYVPNRKKLHIYNFTRFEYRFVRQNDYTQSIPRLRNRVGIEAPLAKQKNAWTPKTFYALADVEPIWRLDDKYLQFVRLRGGAGYIFSKKLRTEVIYYAEFSGPKGAPKEHTGNIWRLNFKLALPRKGVHHHVDVD